MAVITKRQATELRRKITRIRKSHAVVALELCELYYDTFYAEVSTSNDEVVPAWSLWGYEDWDEFVEHEVKVLHWTTAHKYRRVYETFFVDFEGCWEQSELPTSITNLIALTRAPLTERNLAGWLKKGRELSCCQLDHVLGGHGDDDVCDLSMRMTCSQADEFRSLTDKYKETFGVASRGDVVLKVLKIFHQAQGKKRKTKLKIAS